MSQEMMFWEQLFGRSGGGWLPVTMLAGLLLALIFRPNTIHNMTLFRAACWLLALSVAVSPVMSLLLGLLSSGPRGGFQSFGSSGYMPQILLSCVNALGPVMQGASILCGLFSLIPPVGPRRYESAPVKHPLE